MTFSAVCLMVEAGLASRKNPLKRRGAMESKKTFGEYIRERRKELGMTQKEFSEKLYVTESAVSKWERGMSYPDITLLLDICAALDVTEHELLTASVDTQKRSAERMAEKYRRLTRGFCIFMCIILGGVLLGFGIAAIVSHDLWFLPIAAASVMIAASLTLLPFLLARRAEWEPYKWAVSLASMVGSVELLILLCCLRSGSMEWFPMVALCILFGSSLLMLPVFLRQVPLPESLQRCKASLYTGAQSVLLLLMLTACLAQGSSGMKQWPVVMFSVILALNVLFLPLSLCQFPLPEGVRRNKALTYFSVNTVLLLVLLALTTKDWFLPMSLPIALAGLVLPWGLMGVIRYLPVSGWFRASACCAWTGLWSWVFPWVVDKILLLGGWPNSTPYRLRLPVDFSRWEDARTVGWNIFLLVLIVLGVLAAGLAVVGVLRRRKRAG